MAPDISNDAGDGPALVLQNEFVGVREWLSEPSKLGLTPKEIEKRLNGIEARWALRSSGHSD